MTLTPNTEPADMIAIPAAKVTTPFVGFGLTLTDIPEYRVARYETTNAEFSRFVRAGGYENEAHWNDLAAELDGHRPLADVIASFRDTTGRAGPATWAYGEPQPGTETEPVGGVSWYEAKAYARFVGADLPTLYQYGRAALSGQEINKGYGTQFSLRANFNGEVSPVGTNSALGPYGSYDLLGNVQEWVRNRNGDTPDRFILGGSWDSARYEFVLPQSLSPFDRTKVNGFRVVEDVVPINRRQIESIALFYNPDAFAQPPEPISDSEFAASAWQYERSYRTTHREISSKESVHGTRHQIQLSRSSGEQSMLVYLYEPANREPPYSPVVYFPGATGWDVLADSESNIDQSTPFPDFVLKSGRMLVLPVFAGMYERGDSHRAFPPSNVVASRRIQWIKDAKDVLDYLETRGDVKRDSIAYLGMSYGGMMPSPILIDPRFSAAVLTQAGVFSQDALGNIPASGNTINFLPRVKLPTLFLTGKYDTAVLPESQRLLFELLGTPSDKKRWIEYSQQPQPPEKPDDYRGARLVRYLHRTCRLLS